MGPILRGSPPLRDSIFFFLELFYILQVMLLTVGVYNPTFFLNMINIALISFYHSHIYGGPPPFRKGPTGLVYPLLTDPVFFLFWNKLHH